MKTIRRLLPALFYRPEISNDILVTCILEYMLFKIVLFPYNEFIMFFIVLCIINFKYYVF